MSRPTSFRAFTLIELMISIAIVVVLMVGITKVFSLTANTAGATNTIGSAIRDGRAAQTMFYNDLGNAASDMPFMILRSAPQPAFHSKADKLGDRDFNPGDAVAAQYHEIYTTDLDGDNQEGDSAGETSNPTNINNRNHRVDVFSFFARGLYPRQTGNYPDTYIGDMTSQEAWIWYGHLRLQNNAASAYFDPGDTTTGNDTNLYASDWVLGRETILLKAPNSAGVISDRQGNPQFYFNQGPNNFGCVTGGTLTTGMYSINGGSYAPLAYLSQATNDGSGTINYMRSSRYDLAGASISNLAQQVSNYLSWLSTNDTAHSSLWWQSLMSGDLMSAGPPTVSSRFQGKTYVPQPMQSADLAYTSPLFVQHCSQFIVEYAGDYLNQEPQYLPSLPNAPFTKDPLGGQVLGVYSATTNGTDGQLDFYIDANGNRQIRWYGFPRDTAGDPTIGGPNAGNPDGKVTAAQGDVVPLRDLWTQATTYKDANYPNNAPFEKTVFATSSNYAASMSVSSPMPSYECVWGPTDPKPWMIRITMTIDDPSGKLPDGQTFQYVIKLR